MSGQSFGALLEALSKEDLKERIEAVSELLFTAENHLLGLELALYGMLDRFPNDYKTFRDVLALSRQAADCAAWLSNFRAALYSQEAPAELPVLH